MQPFPRPTIPHILFIAERSYCNSPAHWLLTCMDFVPILLAYPQVSIQIRNKYGASAETEAVLQCFSPYIEKHPQLQKQLWINDTTIPISSYPWPRHLPESTALQTATLSVPIAISVHSINSLVTHTQPLFLQFGAIFPTSKPVEPLGLEKLREFCAYSKQPVLAVGGINSIEKVQQCLENGVAGVSIGSWLVNSPTKELHIQQILHLVSSFSKPMLHNG